MSKKIKILFVSILLIFLFVIQITKVNAVNDDEFFYTNKKEITPNEILEMTLDISRINYEDFEFKLTSSLGTDNITVNQNINVENGNEGISIKIDKSKINFDKLTLYYKIPENAKAGSNIELIAQIAIKVKNTEADNETEENTDITEPKYEAVDSKKIDVKVIEKNNAEVINELNNTDKTNTLNNKDNNGNEKISILSAETENLNKSVSSNKIAPSNAIGNTNYAGGSMSYSNVSAQLATETAVYKGSDNNYLSNLEIEGETLNTAFNKENSTYFVETSGNTELNINTITEDSNAKVYITGNDNLKTGDNKILISVTAQNGDVRYYRVFVTNS